MTELEFEDRMSRAFIREQAEMVYFRLEAVALEASERHPETVITGIEEARAILHKALAAVTGDQPLTKDQRTAAAQKVSLAAIWTGVAIGDIRSRNNLSDFLDSILPSE